MNPRFIQLQQWLIKINQHGTLMPLKGDASFRQYYRLQQTDTHYIIMDAPPQQEDCSPYLAIAKAWDQAGINVPKIMAYDVEQGFLLLSDFGDNLLWHKLKPTSAHFLYQQAFDTLLQIQSYQSQALKPNSHYPWPYYDTAEYQKELNLFSTWYLEGLCQIHLTSQQKQTLKKIEALLIEAALQQPQVCVHRDYHSRNLMWLDDHSLGVLDFQDALWGPVTYDLASLLRDCYIDWPQEQVYAWVLDYQQLALTRGIISNDNSQLFIRWFDWMGLQRHLKCMGIFSRLHLRDNKSSYLQYLPRIKNYIKTVCHQYPELTNLLFFLD